MVGKKGPERSVPVETPKDQYGPAALSKPSYAALSLLGRALADHPPGAPLPPSYELHRALTAKVAFAPRAPHRYRGLLPHVARLARQGMTPQQIADRLALPQHAMREALIVLPEFRAAIVGGLAEGVDAASTSIADNIQAHETSAAAFLLKTKGGFNVPKDYGTPAVVVNIGQQPASVDASSIADLKERQSTLLDDVEWSEVD
jgi:hypothetical protein